MSFVASSTPQWQAPDVPRARLIIFLCLLISADAARADDSEWDALVQRAQSAASAGRFGEAEQSMRDIVKRAELKFGSKSAELGAAENNLAYILMSEAQYDESEKHYLAALGIWQAAYGAEHENIALVLNNLGELMFSANNPHKAEQYFERSLKIRKRRLPPDDPALAISYNNLGYVYSAEGRYLESIPLYEKALRIIERKQPNSPELANALHNLGESYRETGDESRAEKLLTRALGLRKSLLGPESPELVVSLNSLGELAFSQGRFAESQLYLSQALEAAKNAGIEERGLLLQSLANVKLELNDLAGAEALYRGVIEAYESAPTKSPSPLPAAYSSLAAVEEQLGKYASSESSERKALAELEREFGSESTQIVKPLQNLARLARLRQSPKDAVPLLVRAIGILDSATDSNAPDLVRALTDLSEAHAETGETVASQTALTRALDLADKVYGANSSESKDLKARLEKLGQSRPPLAR
ncbi:MAG: tetratricopeptide repeat protein [Bdellovibrionota bacterium]